jgi:MEMO1 family protein
MNRKPIACPDYYPTTFDRLDKAINESFIHKKGPGTLQASRRNINLNLISVPCDKIENSGPCSAWGFMEIAESNFPETYILLGTNHHSKTKFSTYLFSNWETPFGIVATNVELGKELTDLFPEILNEHTGHIDEHSIEVQLPWLQFASRDNLSKLSIIPLTINTKDIKEIKKLAKALSIFIKKHNIPIIASTNVEDTPTISYIKAMNTEALINYKQRKEKQIKEIAPILTLMEIANIKNKKPEVINYQKYQNNSSKQIYHASIKFK